MKDLLLGLLVIASVALYIMYTTGGISIVAFVLASFGYLIIHLLFTAIAKDANRKNKK